jgi:CBS domain-containing protein
MEVKEFMNSPVKTVLPGTKIQEAIEIMTKDHIGSVVVESKDGKIDGIVTERDIMKALAKKIPTKEKVDKIMTKKVIAVEPETDLSEAISIMAKNHIKKLIVMEEDTLAGIISVSDILKNLDEYSEELAERISELYSG